MGFLNAFGAIGRGAVAGGFGAAAVAVLVEGGARSAFLAVALALAITGVTFWAIGSKLGRVSSLSRALRATGEAGTATITSLGTTGVRVNGIPVLEVGLDVDVSSHAPYAVTVRQLAPAVGAEGRPAPGARVGVVVDRADRETLAIDWDAVPSPVPAPEAVAAHSLSAPVDAARLLQVGRRAKAVIISMSDAGGMSELGLVEVGSPGKDDRLFVVDMEVQQAGMDAYEVRVAHRVPERVVGRVGPRTRVEVSVDHQDDHAVAIDWDSVGR